MTPEKRLPMPLTAEDALSAEEHPPTLQSCQIISEVKRRTGTLKHWCIVHRAPAWDAKGERLSKCQNANVPPLSKRDVLVLDVEGYAAVAAWGALPPVFDTSNMKYDRGVHVHARREINGRKSIDRTYAAVIVKVPSLLGDKTITLREEDAVAYVASAIFNKQLKSLSCPRCNYVHLDADFFAVNPHAKHQCNGCGREFFDDERSISNPLMIVKDLLRDTAVQRQVVEVDRRLVISRKDCPRGLQIWPSNPAIIWTSSRVEEGGIHVHGYDERGRRIVDDTFGHVEIDGLVLNSTEARYFMAQQSLPHISHRLAALQCPKCEGMHFDTGEWATHPHREHICEHCGNHFVSPRGTLTISNPFVRTLRQLITPE